MGFENPGLVYWLWAGGLAVFCASYFYSLKKAGLSRRSFLLSLCLGALLSLACARLFVFLPELLTGGSRALFPLRVDELSFFGGCAGGALGAVAAAKLCGEDRKAALDALALPGCLLIVFLRLAETGIGFLNMGEMPAFLPAVWPFAVPNGWGLPELSVSTLMALFTLLCAVWLKATERRREAAGERFDKAACVLCAGQIFLEMLCTTSAWIPFIISFIHWEQVLCAVFLLAAMIRLTVKNKKAGPLIVTVLMLGLNALMQFVQDKPYYFPLPEGTNLAALAVCVFALTSVGLIAARLWAGKAQFSTSSKGI